MLLYPQNGPDLASLSVWLDSNPIVIVAPLAGSYL